MPENAYSFQNSDGTDFTRGQRMVAVTAATLAARQTKHEGKIVQLNRAAGVTVTLPRATGSGDVYRFMLGVKLTSNTHVVKVANASDYMRGKSWLNAASNASFNTANTDTPSTETDTITVNGGTQGGLIGDYIEVMDIAKNVWQVECSLSGAGSAATPFSVGV
jgi:hypothetical protein